jgi:Ca2+-binding EF-hand superfamily protein
MVPVSEREGIHTLRKLVVRSTLVQHAWSILLGYLVGGSLTFMLIEGWSFVDALYFCVTALTTVGFGDVAPKTSVGRLLTCVYILAGVTAVSVCLGTLLSSSSSTSESTSPNKVMANAARSTAAVIGVGALFAMASEGWGLVDSIYWAVVTATSVGFGDLSLSPSSRAAALVYVLIAAAAFASQAGKVVKAFSDAEAERQAAAFVAQGVSPDIINEIDADGDGSVERHEFLTYMLVKTGKVRRMLWLSVCSARPTSTRPLIHPPSCVQVEARDIQKINELFRSLDRDGSGSIDRADIIANAKSSPSSESGGEDEAATLLGTGKEHSATLQAQVFQVALHSARAILPSHSPLAPALEILTQGNRARLVDASIAATAVVCCCCTLHAVDATGLLPFRCFALPLLSSAIIFFGGPSPPPPTGFVVGTLGAFFFGVVLHTLTASGSIAVQCFAAGILLLFFKLSGSFFVPTVGLATLLAHGGHHLAARGYFTYLIAPWGVGHLVLYAVAARVAVFRQSLRVASAKQQWRSLYGTGDAQAREAKLREVFHKYDTSGDGFLDAIELKLALRSTTGVEFDLVDCERIISSMDTDGDGVIDFHEFKQVIEDGQHW